MENKLINKFFASLPTINKEQKIQMLDKNQIEETFNDISKTILSNKNLSKKQYQEFLNKYLSYMVSREGLDGCSIVFDNHIKDKDILAYTQNGVNKIFVNPIVFKSFHSYGILFENIASLEHECQHLVDFKNNFKTVPHKNKDMPIMFGNGYRKEAELLYNMVDKQFSKELYSIRENNYARDDEEVHARINECVRLKNLLQNMNKMLEKHPDLQSNFATEQTNLLTRVIATHFNTEKKHITFYKQLINKELDWQKDLNNCITKKLKKLTREEILHEYDVHTLVKALGMNGIQNEENFDILLKKINFKNPQYLDAQIIFELSNQLKYYKHNQVLEHCLLKVANIEKWSNLTLKQQKENIKTINDLEEKIEYFIKASSIKPSTNTLTTKTCRQTTISVMQYLRSQQTAPSQINQKEQTFQK